MTFPGDVEAPTGGTFFWSPVDRTEVLIGQEKKVLKEVKKAIKFRKALVENIKMGGVKENVERMSSGFSKLLEIRGALYAEFHDRVNSVDHEVNLVASKVADRVEALETKVMEVLDQVTEKLAEQKRVVSELGMPSAPTHQELEQSWVEVVQRSRGDPNRQTSTHVVEKAATVKPTRVHKTPRARPLVAEDSEAES